MADHCEFYAGHNRILEATGVTKEKDHGNCVADDGADKSTLKKM